MSASLRGGNSAAKAGKRLGAGEVAKYHALGNDYLVVDAARFGARLTRARIRALCDRHRGVGSDGLLALAARAAPPRGAAPARRAEFALRIYNPDGSEAEKSGNGLRIAARVLWDCGYARRRSFEIETRAGVAPVELSFRSGRISAIAVGLGRASFAAADIPFTGVPGEAIGELLAVAGRGLRVTCVSLGNPHCVLFTKELSRAELLELGPAIERHRRFPRRTNVQLARVRSRRELEILIWERGAGETLASGSSAAAAAAAAFRSGLVDRSLRVQMPGGRLDVEIGGDFELVIRGPATPVMRATLS